jgi:hypothetical protein
MNSSLLDSATVFQTANGKERIYYALKEDSVMCKFSNDWKKRLKELSAQGPKALREEAIVERNGTILFHKFYLQHKKCMSQDILYMIANYYTRLLTNAEVTLIGDAATPWVRLKDKEQTKRC